MRAATATLTSDASGITDHALIVRVAAHGDRHAFSELVKRHQSPLRASLYRMTGGNRALADDIAQEAFILAWKNIGKFRFEARFSTWLYRIAFNAWQSENRRKTECLLDDESEDGRENSVMPPPTQAIALHRDLGRAMASLSEAERAAIEQCYYNDLSHEEAAYVLNIPLGTLKSHVLRAKEKMRRILQDYSDRSMHQGVAA